MLHQFKIIAAASQAISFEAFSEPFDSLDALLTHLQDLCLAADTPWEVASEAEINPVLIEFTTYPEKLSEAMGTLSAVYGALDDQDFNSALTDALNSLRHEIELKPEFVGQFKPKSPSLTLPSLGFSLPGLQHPLPGSDDADADRGKRVHGSPKSPKLNQFTQFLADFTTRPQCSPELRKTISELQISLEAQGTPPTGWDEIANLVLVIEEPRELSKLNSKNQGKLAFSQLLTHFGSGVDSGLFEFLSAILNVYKNHPEHILGVISGVLVGLCTFDFARLAPGVTLNQSELKTQIATFIDRLLDQIGLHIEQNIKTINSSPEVTEAKFAILTDLRKLVPRAFELSGAFSESFSFHRHFRRIISLISIEEALEFLFLNQLNPPLNWVELLVWNEIYLQAKNANMRPLPPLFHIAFLKQLPAINSMVNPAVKPALLLLDAVQNPANTTEENLAKLSTLIPEILEDPRLNTYDTESQSIVLTLVLISVTFLNPAALQRLVATLANVLPTHHFSLSLKGQLLARIQLVFALPTHDQVIQMSVNALKGQIDTLQGAALAGFLKVDDKFWLQNHSVLCDETDFLDRLKQFRVAVLDILPNLTDQEAIEPFQFELLTEVYVQCPIFPVKLKETQPVVIDSSDESDSEVADKTADDIFEPFKLFAAAALPKASQFRACATRYIDSVTASPDSIVAAFDPTGCDDLPHLATWFQLVTQVLLDPKSFDPDAFTAQTKAFFAEIISKFDSTKIGTFQFACVDILAASFQMLIEIESAISKKGNPLALATRYIGLVLEGLAEFSVVSDDSDRPFVLFSILYRLSNDAVDYHVDPKTWAILRQESVGIPTLAIQFLHRFSQNFPNYSASKDLVFLATEFIDRYSDLDQNIINTIAQICADCATWVDYGVLYEHYRYDSSNSIFGPTQGIALLAKRWQSLNPDQRDEHHDILEPVFKILRLDDNSPENKVQVNKMVNDLIEKIDFSHLTVEFGTTVAYLLFWSFDRLNKATKSKLLAKFNDSDVEFTNVPVELFKLDVEDPNPTLGESIFQILRSKLLAKESKSKVTRKAAPVAIKHPTTFEFEPSEISNLPQDLSEFQTMRALMGPNFAFDAPSQTPLNFYNGGNECFADTIFNGLAHRELIEHLLDLPLNSIRERLQLENPNGSRGEIEEKLRAGCVNFRVLIRLLCAIDTHRLEYLEGLIKGQPKIDSHSPIEAQLGALQTVKHYLMRAAGPQFIRHSQECALEFVLAVLESCNIKFGVEVSSAISAVYPDGRKVALVPKIESTPSIALPFESVDISSGLGQLQEPEEIEFNFDPESEEAKSEVKPKAVRELNIRRTSPFVIVSDRHHNVIVKGGQVFAIGRQGALQLDSEIEIGTDRFRVISVVYHVGSQAFGHYFASVMSQSQWIKVNDTDPLTVAGPRIGQIDSADLIFNTHTPVQTVQAQRKPYLVLLQKLPPRS